MCHEYQKDDFKISTNPALLDVDVIHAFLSRSYWARGIPRDLVIKSLDNSLCFGLYYQNRQIGFARVITDYTTQAYLCDVFILETYQGQGLGRWLIECIATCPDLRGIRHLMLATADAQEFYRKIGFSELAVPENFMEKLYYRPWFKPDEVDH
ncbi:MAG TPA: GNAT family N-acetyltransferase [Anaerolineae bacterium]|jgi:GNAT superfamily N-acetyltransferase